MNWVKASKHSLQQINLQVLRDSIATESVDLIYLDPPFNSNATYNVGLLGESGRDRMRGRTAAEWFKGESRGKRVRP